MELEFENDAAFSFLAADEGLANSIASKLAERLNVFVYSERQKELAGADGLEAFSKVFRSDSRIVVVLYREGWGQTRWTRVEETAIKERAWDEGWDFLLVVSLDGTAPVWLPKTRLWFGLERFGVEGAAAVVESRVVQAGGVAKEESAPERAARLAASMEAKRKREARERGAEAVKVADGAVEEFTRALEALADQAASIPQGMPASLKPVPNSWHEWELRVGRYIALLRWRRAYSNTNDDSRLYVTVFDNVERNEARYTDKRVRPVLDREFEFGLDEAGIWVWRPPKSTHPVYTNDRLADWLMKEMLDRAYRYAGIK